MGVAGGLLAGDLPAFDHLLHHGVVHRELHKLARAAKVRPGVAHMGHMGDAAAHQHAHRSGAHAPVGGVLQRLGPDRPVRLGDAPGQQGRLAPLGQVFQSLGKAVFQGVGGHLAGKPPGGGAAHAVAHDGPDRVVGKARGAEIVLIFGAVAALVGLARQFHFLPSFAASSRRSWPQAALMSLPRRRRTVAFTPKSVSSV